MEDNVEVCNFTENIARISSKAENISNIFLYYFLDSDLGKIQTHRLSVGSLQDKLSLINCRNINVLIPYNTETENFDINEQYKIINKVNYIQKKVKENLEYYYNKINEIKLYILQRLKIKLPIEPKTEQTFPYVLSNNSTDRVDALFNNPFRDELLFELKKYSYKKLGSITKIEKLGEILPSEFYNLIDLDDISEDLGEVINIKEVPNLGSSKTVFRKGELLVSKLQPDKGKIILVDDKTDSCVGSSELVPLKLISEDVLLEYLWIILRSDYVLKQWKYEITGSSRERIGKTELKNTIIPIPNKDMQKEIINEVKEKINQAKNLLDEYKTNRQKAKQVFIDMVLNGYINWYCYEKFDVKSSDSEERFEFSKPPK